MSATRIFISVLPVTASEPELKTIFSKYGEVQSIDIKERKNNPKNQSPFYAYVSLNCDNYKLQQCFDYFNNNKWLGEYVELQIAKESFLEKLKREREANAKKETVPNQIPSEDNKEHQLFVLEKPNDVKPRPLKRKINVLEENEEEEEKIILEPVKVVVKPAKETPKEIEDYDKDKLNNCRLIEVNEKEKEELYSDIKIKNNKNKFKADKLQIEGFGKEPIIKIEPKKQKSLDKYRSQANEKRLQSIVQMRQNYNKKKSVLKSALSSIDIKPPEKIVSIGSLNGETNKLSLFDEENESEDEHNYNLEIRNDFQGTGGEKLLKLQSKYANDKRFQLDKKFIEDENDEEIKENNEIDNVQNEKNKEYEILEEILGSSVKRKNNSKNDTLKNQPKTMRRFDPSQPDHTKFELKYEETKKSKKKNEKAKPEETIEPEVSKEVYYEVKENVKDTFEGGNTNFSLLNMFGTQNDEKINDPGTDEAATKITKSSYMSVDNPFKYDSSDDEKNEINDKDKNIENIRVGPKLNKNIKTWTEPLFFKEDDYRFQEGFEFVQKITAEIEGDFSEVRRNIKLMVKSKIRKNQKKNAMFKKKLGGRRKNKIKIRNALKR